MKGKEEDEERNDNICLQTHNQAENKQILNSKTEATLILCGSSGERANKHLFRLKTSRYLSCIVKIWS